MAYSVIKKIRFDDVDGAGIVYYPQYFHLCHAAFEDFFDDAAHISYPDLISKKRLGFPTVAVNSDFKATLVYGDIAIIKLSIKEIGKVQWFLGIEFVESVIVNCVLQLM
jgi:4-hydroxybenzoyl-CoA thioesterase